jgi:transposase
VPGLSSRSQSKPARVGVDLVKRVIQLRAVDVSGKVVAAKALARDKFVAWCVQLPPGCPSAMKACSGAHHWACELQGLGLDARSIAVVF